MYDPRCDGAGRQRPAELNCGTSSRTVDDERLRQRLPIMQIALDGTVGTEPLGQTPPAPGLAGVEERSQPKLRTKRFYEQPTAARGQRVRIDRLELVSKIVVDDDDIHHSVRCKFDPGRRQQATQGFRINSDAANGDGGFREPTGRNAGIDLLHRPPGGVCRGQCLLIFGQESFVLQLSQSVKDFGRRGFVRKLSTDFIRRLTVHQRRNQAVQATAQ